eukprot:scaffold63868_cov19-Tisochrysis_lutea.AAC.4
MVFKQAGFCQVLLSAHNIPPATHPPPLSTCILVVSAINSACMGVTQPACMCCSMPAHPQLEQSDLSSIRNVGNFLCGIMARFRRQGGPRLHRAGTRVYVLQNWIVLFSLVWSESAGSLSLFSQALCIKHPW